MDQGAKKEIYDAIAIAMNALEDEGEDIFVRATFVGYSFEIFWDADAGDDGAWVVRSN